MLRFHAPELLLLAIPLALAYLRCGRVRGITGALRVTMLVLLLLAAAGLEWNLSGKGIDVVVVVDRSRSVPDGAQTRYKELINNLQQSRQEGDRIGVVSFGAKSAVESLLASEGTLNQLTHEVQEDGSNLNEALHTALNLLDNRNRPARILVLSDGESNGASPRGAARRARDRGVPIDFREFPRPRSRDVAVDSVQLPETVAPRQPFQYTVWIASSGDTQGTITVLRDGEIVSQDRKERKFEPGLNRFLYRDVLDEGGLHKYEVRVKVAGDLLEENNRGEAAVRVEEGPRVLVLNADGQENNLTRAIRAGNIPLDVAVAGTHPLTQASLDRYRAVVVENVPANDFGRLKMSRLAQFVEDLGGGLLLTGGERSFGNGGYYRSPLEEVLPVSLEMREEHRKARVAVAIVLDRSGSMAVPVSGGQVKMDLADQGTAECVRMLSRGDSVSVIAVDSAPHIIQPLVDVDDPEGIARKALKIKSQGGGIFIYEALLAAGTELMKATQDTKHIILFSDAADSEEPGDYINLLKKYSAAKISVSVIGLGTKGDSDATLLQDIARRGGGNIYFTDDARDLPRLFSQETMSIARSSFIKKDPKTQPDGIPGMKLAGGRLLGELETGPFPGVDGYNLTYLKPQATQGVVSQDEFKAPMSAFWYRGLGRVAALTVEADGQYSGAFGKSSSYADFLITHVRWLLGDRRPDNVFVTVNRDGQDAVVNVELDPDSPVPQSLAPSLQVVGPSNERTTPQSIPFQWRGAHELQARFRLSEPGSYLPLVILGPKSFVRAAAVTLPYSAEFAPRTGLPTGSDVLSSLAELTGGKPRTDVLEILADPPHSARMLSLVPWLVGFTVVVFLLEIAGRRLSLWTELEHSGFSSVRRWFGSAWSRTGSTVRNLTARPKETASSSLPPPSTPPDRAPGVTPPPTPVPQPAAQSKPSQPTQPAAKPEAAPQTPNVYDIAKRRAKRRLE